MYRLNKLMIFITLILFSFIGRVNALVEPTLEFYVNDYANVLSEETEKYIVEKSNILADTDGTQIVVVTVKSLESMSIEEYSLAIARNFKIGDEKKNNGLLLLLSLEEREFRVEVGYGLEGILNDAKTGRFQDNYIIPYLKENNWNEGIKNGYDAFYAEIVKGNNLTLDYEKPVNKNEEFGSSMFITIIFSGFIIGSVIGTTKESIKKNTTKNSANKMICFYIIIWIILVLLLPNHLTSFIGNLVMFFIGLFTAKFQRGTSGGTYRGGRSSSGGGTISRGGSFGGGGSSRRF